MKDKTKLIVRIAVPAFAGLIVLYLIIGYFYSKGFPCCTWVNGVYCTGKSVDQVNSELCNKFDYKGITIKDQSGATLFVSAKEMDFKIDYTEALKEFIKNQNALSWGIYIFKGLTGQVEPDISCDEKKLAKIVGDWEIFVPQDTLDVSIVKTEKGYELKNELLSVPNKESIIDAVDVAALNAASDIDLSSKDYEDCYGPIKPNATQQEVIDLYSKIEPVINCNITYLYGNKKIPLKDGTASKFLLTNEEMKEGTEDYDYDNPGRGRYIAGSSEVGLSDVRNLQGFVVTQNGDPLISEARIYDFFYKMVKAGYTADALERYKNGEDVEMIMVPKNNRAGNPKIFDNVAEYNYLKKVFSSNPGELKKDEKKDDNKDEKKDDGDNENQDDTGEEIRELTNEKKVDCIDAKKDLGRTYIEVDVSNQHLYYYVDGEVAIETDVVTGDMSKGCGTPSGYYRAYDKQREKTLRGDDYETLVHYWMRLNNAGIGIHDAYWKHEFGGDIYKHNGSHGCINCPPDVAERLWNATKSKTPVIVYYR